MRQKDESKKEAIFAATIQLLNEIGFSEISMSKIAKRAGVSPATIYVYFTNKDDMLRKLYLDVKTKLSTAALSTIDQSASFRQNVAYAMRAILAFLLKHRAEFLFLEQFSNSPLLQNLCIDESVESFGELWSLIEDGKSNGVFKNVDSALLLAYCYFPIEYLAKEHFKSGVPIEAKTIDATIEMSWNAIKA